MSYTDVYIADLNGFDFNDDSKYKVGHTPTRITNYLPQASDLFFSLLNKIKKQEIIGWQVDWGAWVTIMRKAQIIKMIDDYFQDKDLTFSTFQADLDTVRRQIDALDPEIQYGVVCAEL